MMRLDEMEQFMIKKALIATGNNKARPPNFSASTLPRYGAR